MRNRTYLAFDLLAGLAVVFLAFSARFDGLGWWPDLVWMAGLYAGIAIPLRLFVFWGVGLYGRLWSYASIADLEVAVVACCLGGIVSLGVGLGLMPLVAADRVPAGIVVIDATLTAATVTLSRLLQRVLTRRRRAGRGKTPRQWGSAGAPAEGRRVLIAGAGEAGGMIARELVENRQLDVAPIGYLDDDITKQGHRLHGIPVLGPISALESLVQRHKIEEVIIALPSARGRLIREIVQRSTDAGVQNRTVPGLYEILSGAKSVSALRPIQIEDLLRREPIETDTDQVAALVRAKTVLVTGAGGSIGSELCRQLASFGPRQIVALGRGENSIFELVQELRATFPQVPVRPAIVDVRDRVRLRAVFEATKPFSVFHAAAHKHVPLMEASVDEAILNNVLGTRNVAELSADFAVEHLVLVSTDKAVRPTSVMGATKRVAEESLCEVAERTGKAYVSVRFGNVLGSRGSVVPTFLRQIAAGGPITITHPEMRRYFMTIPEAVQLVLQAAALGRGGEVFVLDMGEPVRISDLAEDLIRLSGLEPGSDIEIQYTGVRPGEKLYEELFFGPGDATPTSHPKILRARDASHAPETAKLIGQLIEAARVSTPEAELRRLLGVLVPEYRSTGKPTPELGELTVQEPGEVLTQHGSAVR
jgi:FlaA1/EpsC-like NDP-sugar epimerase